MNRRNFIKKSITASLILTTARSFAIQSDKTMISNPELIGLGNPELFGSGFLLRKEAFTAFNDLKKEALKSNIRIQVVSSYRGFDHQNRIWKRKYNRYTNSGLTPQNTLKKIIEYSTIPGTSRHHWGTDIDIIDANANQPSSVLQPRHFGKNGCYEKLKLWMDNHAERFGFYLVYTNEATRKGFNYEPWHYSYKPLSKLYLKAFLKLNIEDITKNEKLLGHSYMSKQFILNYLNHHILDINPELL